MDNFDLIGGLFAIFVILGIMLVFAPKLLAIAVGAFILALIVGWLLK